MRNYRSIISNRGSFISQHASEINDKIDDDSRIALTWNTLREAAVFPGIMPCVKRYLFSHVQSTLLKINPQDWRTAIMLPVQQFEKVSSNTVWRHSITRS